MKCNEKYEQDISSLTDVTSILDTRCEKGLDLHITRNSRSLPFLQVLDLLTCQEKDGWRGKGRCFLLTKLPEKPILFQGTFSLCANAFKGERWELPLPLTPPHQLWKARHPGAWAGAGMSTEQQEFQTGSLTPISLRGELLISLVRRKYFLLEKLCNAPIPIFFLLGCPHRSACGQLWAGAVCCFGYSCCIFCSSLRSVLLCVAAMSVAADHSHSLLPCCQPAPLPWHCTVWRSTEQSRVTLYSQCTKYTFTTLLLVWCGCEGTPVTAKCYSGPVPAAG